MTALIVSSLAAALELDGVYGLEVDPPQNAPTPGLDWVGFVGRFAWGPVNEIRVIDGQADYLDAYAPGGLGYTATGHRSLARAKVSRLKIVRVSTNGIATAAMVLQSSGAVDILNLAAKYPGTLGGQITIVIAAADDGVATHFNLTASLGTESETYRNLTTLSTGVVLGSQTSSKILAPLSAVTGALGLATRPVSGTYVLGVAATNVASPVAGADGTATAALYTGTAGTGDAGLALLEGDTDVTIVATDDCGSSLRLAVNTALVAHAEAESRLCYIALDSGTTLATAITHLNTNAAALRSERAILAWPWVYQMDHTGTRELVHSAAIRAGALSKMIRSLGQHWKHARNTDSFRGVVALEYSLGRANHILAKAAGISPLVAAGSAWAPKNDATTSLIAGKTKVARRRIADFVMRLVTAGQEPYEGGSIDPATRSRQIAQVQTALQPLKDAATRGEAEITEAIEDFSVATASSGGDLAAGLHRIRVQVKSFATQDFIVFLVSVGATVTVEEVPVAA